MTKLPINNCNFETVIRELAESVDHMKVNGRDKEIVKAGLRSAVEYVSMRRAGFVLQAVAKNCDVRRTNSQD